MITTKRKHFIKKIILIIIVIFVILLIFFPKQSGFKETEFAIQQRIRQRMTEQESRERARRNEMKCECLGFEIPDKLISYSTSYVCYGLVLKCDDIK